MKIFKKENEREKKRIDNNKYEDVFIYSQQSLRASNAMVDLNDLLSLAANEGRTNIAKVSL